MARGMGQKRDEKENKNVLQPAIQKDHLKNRTFREENRLRDITKIRFFHRFMFSSSSYKRSYFYNIDKIINNH